MDNEISTKTNKKTIDELLSKVSGKKKHWGLPIVKVGSKTYAIATTKEERVNAGLKVMGSTEVVANYDPQFIHKATGLNTKELAQLSDKGMAVELKEYIDSNGELKNLARAIADNGGFGEMLAIYDGEEIRLDCGYYAYLLDEKTTPIGERVFAKVSHDTLLSRAFEIVQSLYDMDEEEEEEDWRRYDLIDSCWEFFIDVCVDEYGLTDSEAKWAWDDILCELQSLTCRKLGVSLLD